MIKSAVFIGLFLGNNGFDARANTSYPSMFGVFSQLLQANADIVYKTCHTNKCTIL